MITMWVVARLMKVAGERARPIAQVLRSLSWSAERHVSVLLDEVPDPVMPAGEPLAAPTMAPLAAWAPLAEVVPANKGGYYPPEKARPRRAGSFTRGGR